MSENYDDLIAEMGQSETQPADTASQVPELSKEEFAAKKQAERESVSALVNDTALSIGESSDNFKNYLKTLSRFERYSPHNTVLIHAQKPDATKLSSYDNWLQAGTPVIKGKTGISIYEPGKEYTRDDGTTAVSMNIKKVFDISQTSAKSEAAPDKKDIRVLLKALISNSPAPIKLVDPLNDNVGARYNEDNNVIEVSRGLDGENLFRAISNEQAYASLYKQNPDTSSFEDINFAAYSASYVISEKNGIDTKMYDFSESADYFAHKDSKEIIGEIRAIRDAAHEIASRMTKELNTPQKEAKAQEAR
jgi:predicted acetyltransferase